MTSGGGKTPITSSLSTNENEDIATQIESAKRNQKKLKSLVPTPNSGKNWSDLYRLLNEMVIDVESVAVTI